MLNSRFLVQNISFVFWVLALHHSTSAQQRVEISSPYHQKRNTQKNVPEDEEELFEFAFESSFFK